MMMTLSGRWVRSSVLVLVAVVSSVVARGQDVSGSISGTILDPTGASVGGAIVTLTNTDRGEVERTATTSKAGYFTATSLPLGHYSVSVATKGFKTATVTGLMLNANDALKVDQKLAVGTADQTVNVVASEVQLNFENGMSQGLVNGTQLRELVLNNRNYEQLLNLQPGVAYGGANDQLYIGASLPSGTSNTVNFSVNGERATANNWTIDGADNVDRGSNLTLLVYPSVDAISEFKTLRGTYTAEFGRSASSQVNVVTRSGTNAFHGNAYEFFRNNVFNANSYFNKLAATPVARPLLRYNDFGFTLGGPVEVPKYFHPKQKTFFFYSQEFRRVINYASVTVLLPTNLEASGNFGTAAVCTQFVVGSGACSIYGTSVPATQLSPTAKGYLKDVYGYGTPNDITLSAAQVAANVAANVDPHTFISNQRNVFNNTQELGRVDHAFGSKVNFFYRYVHDSFPSTEAGGLFVGGGIPGAQTTNTTAPGTQHIGHLTMALKPTLLVNMGYAYSSGAILSTPVGTLSQANSTDINPVLPYTPTLGIVPNISFSGNATGLSSAGIYKDYNRDHNGFGDLTKVVGQHTVKFGLTYNHYQKMENATGNGAPYPQGFYSFSPSVAPTIAQNPGGSTTATAFQSTFANFLIGNANGSAGGFTQGSAALTPNLNENLIEVYLQDDWRATRRLMLNLGVRYSYFGQPYDNNHLLSNFDPDTYTPLSAETVDSNGLLCETAVQNIIVAPATVAAIQPCLNANYLYPTTIPNPNADSLDGIILGSPGSAYPLKASPFNAEVGHADHKDFAPRFGFAYDVFGDGKTALRGGYGFAYDDSAVSIYETAAFNNPPYLSQSSYATALLDTPVSGTSSVNLTPPTLYGVPVNNQTPYVQQFSLDVQQALSSTLMLDVGYFGDHGTHLQGKVDINEARPGAFAAAGIAYNGTGFRNNTVTGFVAPTTCAAFTSALCEQPLNQVRPYVGYGPINTVRTIFNSNYEGLQVKVTKKFSGASFIDANYTWSRALTNAQSDYSSAPQNTYNLAAEYGRSSLDRTNILTVDAVWELPWYRSQKGIVGRVIGGWQASGIAAVNSGLPLTVTATANTTISYIGATSVFNPSLTNGGLVTDAAGLGIIGASAAGIRPNMVLNPNNGYGQYRLKTRSNWFNRTAFTAPAPGSYSVGNEKRGVIEGPGFSRVDVGLFRNFRIYEGVAFQVRGEAFNVINHTNFQGVCTNASGSGCLPYSFGQVTSTRDPRLLQVGGKLSF
jgi:hypothetical protein